MIRSRHLISNANFTTESVILTLEMICHENSSGKFYTCNETSIGVMCGSSSRFCNYTPINQFTDNLTPTYYEDVSRFNLFKAFTTWRYSIVAFNTLITRVYKSRTKYRKYLSVGNLKHPAIFYQWAEENNILIVRQCRPMHVVQLSTQNRKKSTRI